MKKMGLAALGLALIVSLPAEAQGFGGGGGGPQAGGGGRDGPGGNGGPDGNGGPGFGGGGGRDGQLPRVRRRGLAGPPVDYFSYAETTPMWTIASPVTGFGNEALWENVDPHFAPAKGARVSTARVASR